MKRKRILYMILTLAAAFAMLCVPAFAAGGSGDVSGAVEQTWTAAAGQLKTKTVATNEGSSERSSEG